jgi:dihydroorotate dehydrogenase electron transfer subunit
MAIVISNIEIASNIYVMRVAGQWAGTMGQFYMIRHRTTQGIAITDPLLSRPLSIHDQGDNDIAFLYRVVGRGTALLTHLTAGQEIQLSGPFGNGFPIVESHESVALVGGGMGVAPLLLAAKHYRKADIYLGYSDQPFAIESFTQTIDSVQQLHITQGIHTSIVDHIDPTQYSVMMACGPAGMLQALAAKIKAVDAPTSLYISTEKRMACGIGACLTCSIQTAHGNRRVCKEGPVFTAEEVNWNDLSHM